MVCKAKRLVIAVWLLLQLMVLGLLWPLVFYVHERYLRSKGLYGSAAYHWWIRWTQSFKRILYHSPCQIEVVGDAIPSGIDERVLLLANHRSWLDIIVIEGLTNKPVSWVLKRSLFRIPILGQVFSLCHFPGIDRKKKVSEVSWQHDVDQFLEKAYIPSLAIFPEGTRYQVKKAKRSRYKHLLNPHVAGLGYVISHYEKVIDISLIYDGSEVSIWGILSGKVNKLTVVLQDVTSQLDATDKRSLHRSLNHLWQEKDKLISGYLSRVAE